MAARKKRSGAPGMEPPRIHQAGLAPGASGAVVKGKELDQAAAIAQRQAGENVVVCGESRGANRSLAYAIESAIGPCERQEPHDRLAGPLALPHFQQMNRAVKGHTFYETENRKAKPTP